MSKNLDGIPGHAKREALERELAERSDSDESSSDEEEVDVNRRLVEYCINGASDGDIDGMVEEIESLIEEGANVDYEDPENEGKTPLQLVLGRSPVEHDDSVAILAVLIKDRRANFYKKYSDGSTLLHKAANHGFKEITKKLIDAGIDVNTQDDNGNTPIHKAASFIHAKTVELLIDEGADLTKINIYGESPLYLAIKDIFNEDDEAVVDIEESQWRIQIAARIAKAIEEKDPESLSNHLEMAHIAGENAKYLTPELIKLICSLQDPRSETTDPESSKYLLDLIIKENSEREGEIRGYIDQAHKEFAAEAAQRKREGDDDLEGSREGKRGRPDSSPSPGAAGPAAGPASPERHV